MKIIRSDSDIRQEVKRKIILFLCEKRQLDHKQVMNEIFPLDYKTTISLFKELEKEGRIKIIER